MADQIGQGIHTVVAGGDYRFGFRGLQLVGFDFGGLEPERRIFGHGHGPAAPGTAIVLRPVRIHFAKISHHEVQEFSRFFEKSAAAGVIAGVVESDGKIVLVSIHLDSPFLDVAEHGQNGAFYLEGSIHSRPIGTFASGGPVAMTTLG